MPFTEAETDQLQYLYAEELSVIFCPENFDADVPPA
jgi:hypothetical protein